MTDKLPDIKECPILGCENLTIYERDYPGGTWYWMECNDCGLRTEEHQSKKNLIEYWNTRYTPVTTGVY